MRHSGIPVYCYPTTTVFVDDRVDFLTNFSLQLHDKLAIKLFSKPHEALAFVKKSETSAHVGQRSLDVATEIGGNPITNHTVTLDLSSIQQEMYNPNRFAEVGVVVVDYDMPGMNGLDFCRKLADTNIKKILLTGKGDEKVAVEAFNEGLIDHFIQKNNRHVINLVNENIARLQTRYFQAMSENMQAVLMQNSASFASDATFCEFFHDLCKKNNIVEYYLTELTGSYLMLDANANLSLLVVKCYEDLNIHYEFAADNGAPQIVLDEIRSGNKIPYAWSADDYFKLQEAEAWEEQLYTAEEIKGKEIYYYSFVNNIESLSIDRKNLVSYNQYLQQTQQ